MAWEIPGLVKSFEAAGDISTKQFYFMKLDSNGRVTTCTGATDTPIGVLQNKPSALAAIAEVMIDGISKVSADAALSIGAKVGTSADGQADAKTPGTDTTEYVVGTVITATTAAAGLATIMLDCKNAHRGA